MKTLFYIVSLFLSGQSAHADQSATFAFERLQHELDKAPALNLRPALYAEYLGDLDRALDAPSSPSNCLRAVFISPASLESCEPISFQFARIGGGTGGVE